MVERPYKAHLQSSDGLITSYEATRAGFVALALEKNRRATPYVAEARALQEAASKARTPADLARMVHIRAALLTAAGLSDKSLKHLQVEDKDRAIAKLIEEYLEPAGKKFVEELVFRFLLTRGDSLGGSMRNVGGVLAERKFTRAVISALTVAGIHYQWLHLKTRAWINMSDDDADIEMSLRGLSWQADGKERTLLYNITVPIIKNNVDLCLFNLSPKTVAETKYALPEMYIALGELKGGIDPAGADEHWKTAHTALERIRSGFTKAGYSPFTFFVGAAVEKKMALEIWHQLENGTLSNAANLNDTKQVASVARWLCHL